MDSEKLKTISLKELYLYYNNIDKNKNPEQAAIILELIKERENSSVEPVISLAKLSDRLLARLVDGVIFSPFIIVYFIFFTRITGIEDSPFGIESTIYYFLFTQVVFLLLNGYLLSARGQTIGKLLFKIKIVTLDDNSIPTFDHIYGLRYFLIFLISSIPVFGWIFGTVDPLFIFREDRRCLHDMIAGTRVIEV
ncbi:MAG: hypothetical protein SCALA702_10740 [Melioribacteraceae bacterium]|nr:MAG: hypothetical protein SCALA702_10740 [Melioribacteraceae bacterium]